MMTRVAPLAQLAEQLTLNQRVDGSSPSGGILENKPVRAFRPICLKFLSLVLS